VLPARQPKKQKRESRWRSQAHLKWIRGFHCAWPGCDRLPIEAAHIRIGSGTGMGQKPDDWMAVPLCRECHSMQHTIGEGTFWLQYADLAGQTVDELVTSLWYASPKSAEIRRERQERNG
jgi:hypothetical protein